jgi:hypothetical protein
MLNFVTNYGHAWQRITASTLDFQDLMLNFVAKYGLKTFPKTLTVLEL